MRPAIAATKRKNFKILDEQVNRSYRTSVWLLRNAEDSIKADVKVIHESLKTAVDELDRLRDRVAIMWAKDKPAAAPTPVDQAKVDAMTQLMPGVAPDDAARVIHLLGEILGQHAHSNNNK
jgi:ribosomal protein S20